MRSRRSAFTLIEILVVITILLALTMLIVLAFRPSSADATRSGARIAQSAFLGARDRALHAKAPRGIRLLRDPGDSSIVIGFAYVQMLDRMVYPEGSIQLERRDDDNDGLPDSTDVVIVNGFATIPPDPPVENVADWAYVQPYFSDPPRIMIPAGGGDWYPFVWFTSGKYALTTAQPYLQLMIPFADPGAPGVVAFPRSGTTFTSCEIELGAELLPNHAPISMPSGVVIDLDYSSSGVVSLWPTLPTPTNADIMFAPEGRIVRPTSGAGPLHFLLNDIQDATQNLNPIDPANKGEKLILTVLPQTGHVQTYPIDPTDSDNDGNADDLFRFAKTGSRAGN